MSRLRLYALACAAGLAALSACAGHPLPSQTPDFPTASYPDWKPDDAAYRFYPGDRLRIDVRTAPELSAELTIGPDGRIALPGIGPVMAGGMSTAELKSKVEGVLGAELRDPSLVITPTAFGSQKIFVGGEVKQPGVFELPGAIDPLQAIPLAGGWTDAGEPTHVIIMRRLPAGQLAIRIVDVRNGIARNDLSALGPLRRFDVVFVTRKAVADQNLFVKQFIRDALPIDFSLFYDVARF